MKKLIAAIVAGFVLSAHALPKDEDLWSLVTVDAANGDRYSILNKSGMVTKNDNGMPVVAAQGRIVAKDNTRRAYSWYVPLANCDAGQGQLVIMTPSGDYLDKALFAFGSGTIASGVATVLCGAAEEMIKNNVAPVPNPQLQQSPQKKPANPNSMT